MPIFKLFKRPRPILFRLIVLVIVALVPVWAVGGLILYSAYESQRVALEEDTIATARALGLAVDADLATGVGILQALATSPFLSTGDLAAFHAQARQILSASQGSHISLTDASGKLVLSTLRPFGEALPPSGGDLLGTVFRTGKPATLNLYTGAISGELQVAVAVPVMRNGKIEHALSMGLLPSRLLRVLREEHLPPSVVASILDTSGTVITQTKDAEKFVGHKATPELLQRIAEVSEGMVIDQTLEDIPVLAGFSQSSRSGWTVVLGIPITTLTEELRRSVWLSAGAVSGALLLTFFLCRQQTRRITGSIQSLIRPALALAADTPLALPTFDIRELADVGEALAKAKGLLVERTRSRDLARAAAEAHQADIAHASRVSLAGEMAAGIAHELSQPLTSIVAYGHGCLELLAAPNFDKSLLNEGVAQIVSEAERAGAVLTHLRDLVRRGAPSRRPVQVDAIIRTAVSLAELDAGRAGVTIDVRTDPGLPLAIVDDIQIEQVLLNLIRNAIDAMADTSDRRQIIIEARRENDDLIEVVVSDTGPGIATAMRDLLFQPFETTKAKGMGVGLAICRTIVEAHGGNLRWVPNAGRGARFIFDLPISRESIDVR